ncbi:unnamed protein product [Caenorhabditis nigoni]
MFGAVAVGSSTCHVVTVSRHCGVKVLGFAWITNSSDSDDALDALRQFGQEELEFSVEVMKDFNQYGYYKIFMEQWFQRADEIFRPSSAWLSVIISLVRVLVVKFPLNSKFDILSKPTFAICSILATMIVWFMPVFFFNGADRIEDTESPWCGFPENYTEPRYQYGVPESFLSGLMMSYKVYQYILGCGKVQ